MRAALVVPWGVAVFFALLAILNGSSPARGTSIYPDRIVWRPGDDIGWSLPAHDDRDWSDIRDGDRPAGGLFWYRFHFTIPADPGTPPSGLWLAPLADADEAFFNGVKIGGAGIIANRPVMAPRVHRVYRIPPGLVRPGKDNVLAVRGMNLFFHGNGAKDQVVLGEYWRLTATALRQDRAAWAAEPFLFAVLLCSTALQLILYWKLRDRTHLLGAAVLGVYALVLLIESRAIYAAGLKTPFLQRADLALFSLIPACFLCFMDTFARRPCRATRWFALGSLLFAACILVFFSLSLRRVFAVLWAFGFLPIFLLLSLRDVAAISGGKVPGAGPIHASGIIFAALLLIGDTSAVLHIVPETVFGVFYPQDYAILIFALLSSYVVVSRFVAAKTAHVMLARRVLTAQEDERRRIAAELHDGLGQQILTVKFHLQAVNEELQNRPLARLADDLDGCIDLVREIAAGLSPALLDRIGLGSLLKMQAKRIADRTGLALHVAVETPDRIVGNTAIHLFRIFQEAVRNVLHHARATHIDIRLWQESRQLCIRITDNGQGFDVNEACRCGKGIGLSTIRERAELLGGRMIVKSVKGQGTSIQVEVPV